MEPEPENQSEADDAPKEVEPESADAAADSSSFVISSEELQALLTEQVQELGKSKVLAQGSSPIAAFILQLESSRFVLGKGQRTRNEFEEGTMLTPDQDVRDMDATIPRSPEPLKGDDTDETM